MRSLTAARSKLRRGWRDAITWIAGRLTTAGTWEPFFSRRIQFFSGAKNKFDFNWIPEQTYLSAHISNVVRRICGHQISCHASKSCIVQGLKFPTILSTLVLRMNLRQSVSWTRKNPSTTTASACYLGYGSGVGHFFSRCVQHKNFSATDFFGGKASGVFTLSVGNNSIANFSTSVIRHGEVSSHVVG